MAEAMVSRKIPRHEKDWLHVAKMIGKTMPYATKLWQSVLDETGELFHRPGFAVKVHAGAAALMSMAD